MCQLLWYTFKIFHADDGLATFSNLWCLCNVGNLFFSLAVCNVSSFKFKLCIWLFPRLHPMHDSRPASVSSSFRESVSDIIEEEALLSHSDEYTGRDVLRLPDQDKTASRSSTTFASPPEGKGTVAVSSMTLRRSMYILVFVLGYAALAIFAWTVTCILSYRPITTDHYGMESLFLFYNNRSPCRCLVQWRTSLRLDFCNLHPFTIRKERAMVPGGPCHTVYRHRLDHSFDLSSLLEGCRRLRSAPEWLVLAPNHSPGRQGLDSARIVCQAPVWWFKAIRIQFPLSCNPAQYFRYVT